MLQYSKATFTHIIFESIIAITIKDTAKILNFPIITHLMKYKYFDNIKYFMLHLTETSSSDPISSKTGHDRPGTLHIPDITKAILAGLLYIVALDFY